MSAPGLKPCPWGWDHHQHVTSNGHENYYVQCECGASGPVAPDQQQAELAWNDRSEPPA